MALKITLSAHDSLQQSADMAVIGVAEGMHKKGAARALAKAVGSTAGKALKRGDFSGKAGQSVTVHTAGKVKPSIVLLVGLGPADQIGYAELRRLAARGARHANAARCSTMSVAVPEGIDSDDAERALAEGAVLGSYRFEQFKTDEYKAKFPLEKVAVLTTKKVNAALREYMHVGQRRGEAVVIARDLINTPPNELYPETLAAYAKQVAADGKAAGLSCKVFGPKQVRDKGMNLLNAVGQGSSRGAHFVHMSYRPPNSKGKQLKRLVFVGKGITFDTGGICLKPAPNMDEMKGDMGGAANIVALMAAVAVVQPNAEIHGLIASAENMPDGASYRPGDVFTSLNGKTVEIINTDAEGRLALADALAYGVALEPDFMLDNATLTGACVVALGPTVSAYFSNRSELSDAIGTAAKRAGEAMWHMPLVEDLREQLKSEWADVKHMGDRWGGSITAALFLREFVGDTPWIHVDIAGPSMAGKSYDIYTKGGTGHGVLTYLELIDELIAEPAAAPEAEAADAG
jgi:leucyl aminopeptidase